MSISTRITSIEEHIGDIYDTLELGGADLTNTNKNLVNIEPILKQKYLDYMNNGTQEIWNNWEKVTGTGEEVSLNNTVQAPMDLGVGGNSEQVQYSGKNKLPATSRSDSSNGIITTLNKDGSMTISGTSTATWFVIGESNIDVSIPAGQYTFSTKEALPFNIRLDCTYEDDTVAYLGTIIKGNTTRTFTSGQAVKKLFIETTGGTSGTTYNSTLYLQLETGSTATAYEPYVGGTASPNPSYPQPITNVTGDVEVLVQNKNLANFDIASFQFRVLTEKINANTFKVKKNYQSGATTYGQIEMNLKSNTTYTIIFTSDKTDSIVSCWKDYNGVGNIKTNLATNTPFSFTTTQEKFVCGLYMNNDLAQNTEVLFQFMILEGSYTTETIPTYVEHQEQTYTFPLGTQRMYLGDYLADNGIHHVRKQVVFDGSNDENWVYANSQFSISGTNYLKYSDGGRCYSSHFIGSAIDDLINANLHMWIGNSNFIVCQYDDISSLEDWKTWLSSNNVTVEYELAEEEITPYTTEQQTAYDEIKQAISYEEQTNISGESDEAKPIFTVVALKNI